MINLINRYKLLLGIGGYAGAGKDAVADIIEDSNMWYRTFMSKPLLQAMTVLNPYVKDNYSHSYIRFVDLVNLKGYTEAKKNEEVRRLLQIFGTEVGRELIDPDIWTKQIHKEVKSILDTGISVVVTGIRFPNEMRYINNAGGVTLWIERPGYGPVNSHSSDNTLSVDDFDYIIYNDGTLEELKQKVLEL